MRELKRTAALLFLAASLFAGAISWAFPADEVHTLKNGDLDRRYYVHLPPAYETQKPLPVVLALHGGGSNGKDFSLWSRLNVKADVEGFIVAYPDGYGVTVGQKFIASWNAGSVCPPPSHAGIDDVGFLKAVVSDLRIRYGIDTSRVYATGHSNGAQMVYRLAYEAPDWVAAVAPVGAVMPLEGMPKPGAGKALPILHIHGKEDPCTPYHGGTCGGCAARLLTELGKPTQPYTWPCADVEKYVAQWAARMHLDRSETRQIEPGVWATAFHKSRPSVEVALISVENMGHVWPGGTYGPACLRPRSRACQELIQTLGPMPRGVSLNDWIWNFFVRYQKSASPHE